MICSSETYEDVKKYFQGTYVYIPDIDPSQFLSIGNVNTQYMTFLAQDGTEGGVLWKDGPFEMKFQIFL